MGATATRNVPVQQRFKTMTTNKMKGLTVRKQSVGTNGKKLFSNTFHFRYLKN